MRHAKLCAFGSTRRRGLTAGQEEPFSITMSAADAGYKQGVVVLTADGQDSVKIGVKGLARDPDKV